MKDLYLTEIQQSYLCPNLEAEIKALEQEAEYLALVEELYTNKKKDKKY